MPGLRTNLSRAAYPVFYRSESLDAYWTASVKLLGAYPEFRAETELAAVGKAGGGVRVHARRVNPPAKRLRGLWGSGENRLGMTGAVTVYVIYRLIEGVNCFYR
jgi:hypothetical protein